MSNVTLGRSVSDDLMHFVTLLDFCCGLLRRENEHLLFAMREYEESLYEQERQAA